MYSSGTVYKIICLCDSNIVYIGSTFNLLKQRWQEHKNHYKKNKLQISIYPYFDKYGLENFKCVKIKNYIVYREHQRDFKHLRVYEQLWISKTGKKCINKNNAINIQWISNKNYGILNKEKISKHKKEYHKRPEVKEARRIYATSEKRREAGRINDARPERKARKKELNSIRYTCEICGKNSQLAKKKRHEQSKFHKSFL